MKRIVLCVLDGWGVGGASDFNAIHVANTPNWDVLSGGSFPYTELQASSSAVGLPEGQMGNSEVGHMTIGGGRILEQNLSRINNFFTDNEIAQNDDLNYFMGVLKNNDSSCHVLGLLSPGGVHSHYEHIIKMVEYLDDQGIRVMLHLFTDGRDVPSNTASVYVQEVMNRIEERGNIQICTVSGRFYAMDRDENWSRTERAYRAIAEGVGRKYVNPVWYINDSLQNGCTDEYIIPGVSEDYHGMGAHDGVIMMNFRQDRARQIVKSLAARQFDFFKREHIVDYVLGIVAYGNEIAECGVTSVIKDCDPVDYLGSVIARQGMKQLRLAETEKYAHVTFFFDGGSEASLMNCDYALIPSPKCERYSEIPEMSARLITDYFIQNADEYDFVVMNYANADMVGHTGNMEAAVCAVEVLDECMGVLMEFVKDNPETVLLITADHGNIEDMHNSSTTHTINKVPFIIVTEDSLLKTCSLRDDGGLCDIAATILGIFGIVKSELITGNSLIKK